MWHVENEKKGKITEGIELSNQERIKTLRKMKKYKFLGLLEADIILKAEKKEEKTKKKENSTSDERENFIKHSSAVEILLKEYTFWRPSS